MEIIIVSLAAILLFLDIYFRITERKYGSPRNTIPAKHIALLGNSAKVMISFYIEYEIADIRSLPDEKELEKLAKISLDKILAKKKTVKLDKKKISKQASELAKKIEKSKNPFQDRIGRINICIFEEIRKALPEETEEKME